MTSVTRGIFPTSKDLGELHYFISGAHWKHVDASGATTALYEPETHLVHYFKPQIKVVDVSLPEAPATFEALTETRVVLGRKCKGMRRTSSERKLTGFYDPELFVDQAPYANHHLGHWTETLAFTHGALLLWSEIEFPQGDMVSEPISIQPREFDASFWLVPKPEPG